MKTAITRFNISIAKMAILCFLFSLYANFTFSQETVTDVDGNVYQTVVINGAIWTVSNYRVTKYVDGSSIPANLNNADWTANTDGAYADPPTGDATVYGLLYNGYAVRNTTHGGIAVPSGWRIATDEDWQALETYLGMTTGDLTTNAAWRGASPASVGQKLKSTTTDWTSHANAGIDEVGFKALPAGTRGTSGTFSNANQQAAFWTPIEGVETDSNYTNRRALNYNRVDIHRADLDKRNGLSVRLVKISTTPVELINYKLKQNLNSVTLSWETVSEQNNDYFTVERSADGVNFSEIARSPGKGTINQKQSYFVTDYFPVNGINYYRLKQYDKNGTVNNYGIKAANFKLDNAVSATVVPNPVVAGTSITLNLTGYEGNKLSASLIRLDGTVVQKWEHMIIDSSQSSYILDLNAKLVAGHYVLHVQGDGFSQSAKLIVQLK